MMAHDPAGKRGPKYRMPDNVEIHEPKEDVVPEQPTQDDYYGQPAAAETPAVAEQQPAAAESRHQASRAGLLPRGFQRRLCSCC